MSDRRQAANRVSAVKQTLTAGAAAALLLVRQIVADAPLS